MRTKVALVLAAASTLVATRASADPSVWAIDDGEKIRRDATHTPFERGEQNPVWRPGEAVRLTSMRNETVALQVVVEADDDPLDAVTVDLYALDGPDGAVLADDHESGTRAVGQPIERYVEHFSSIERPSRDGTGTGSVGWEPDSGPPSDAWVGAVPDALVPVASAEAWAPYPMKIEPRSNGIVWIDLHVPRRQKEGSYHGTILVRSGDTSLAKLPLELEVAGATLPDRTVDVAAAYDRSALARRAGQASESAMWQLLRASRIVPVHDLEDPRDLYPQADALSGALYQRNRGYLGPGEGIGDAFISIGAHGALDPNSDATLALVQSIADGVSDAHGFALGGVFLWASDEQCGSAAGRAWKKALSASKDRDAQRVKVGWTCTQDPTLQPVDVPILRAAWDPVKVRAAREQGKEPWVYGGVLPRTGTLLMDADAVSPRVNGWLQAMYGIPRWLLPDVAHWEHDGGQTLVDPFADPETLATADGGTANGGDMLVYPGTQLDDFHDHSLGIVGVLPSIRLFNLRRGIEDAGYLQMARKRDPVRADAVARWLVPAAFGDAKSGQPAAWSTHGKPFFEARSALLAIALGETPPDLGPAPAPALSAEASTGPAATGCTRGAGETGSVAVVALVLVAAVTGRSRRGRRSQRAGAPALP